MSSIVSYHSPNLQKRHAEYPLSLISFSAIFLCLLLFLPQKMLAQTTVTEKQKQVLEQLKEDINAPIRSKNNSDNFLPSAQDLSSFRTVMSTQTWQSVRSGDPRFNFDISRRIPLGDINGDDRFDYVASSVARDEQTPQLEDRTGKAAIFLGGNASTTPDNFLREFLVPAGDLNSDGFNDALAISPSNTVSLYTGSSSGLTNSGTTFTIGSGNINLRDVINQNRVQAFHDLDGDGHSDLVLNNNTAQLIVFWGASSTGNISWDGFQSSQNRSIAQFSAGTDTTQNSADLVVASINSNDLQQPEQLDVISFNSARTPDTLQTLTKELSGDRVFNVAIPYMEDIDGNNFSEIIILTSAGAEVLTQSSAPDSLYSSQSSLLSSSFDLTPIGDLDNDGRMDFYGEFFASEQDQDDFIAFGPSSATDSLTRDVAITENETRSISAPDWRGINVQVNTDTENDALLRISNDQGSGPYFVLGTESGNRSNLPGEPLAVLHNQPAASYTEADNVGDVNGDGIEDLVFARNGETSTAELYFGGSPLSGTPDLILNESGDNSAGILDISGGDFNGDGFSDVIIGFNNVTSGGPEIFYGGPNMDGNVDDSLRSGNLLQDSEQQALNFPKSVGDVNGDGFDDIITHNPFAVDTTNNTSGFTFITFGGSSISKVPDVTISFQGQNNNIWSSSAAGDLNEDGIDDFVLGNFTANNNLGTVEVFFGNSNGNFSTPDMTLTDDANGKFLTGRNVTGGGDFNGDGIADIAAYSTFNTNDNEDLISVFHGGANMDSLPDQHLDIPESAVTPDGSDNTFTGGLETVSFVSDLNGDGFDDLVGTSGNGFTHAAIYQGDSTETDSLPSTVAVAPNQSIKLGSDFYSQGAAIGDFTNSGSRDIVLIQSDDNNDARFSSRAYRYAPSPTDVGVIQVATKDTVGQQGGTVQDTTTGAKVDIPANALSSDTEIEVGTFSAVPDSVDISGTAIHMGPDGTTFNEPVDVTIPYDPNDLPDGINNESELVMIRYDGTQGIWEELETTVNTQGNTMTAQTQHFSGFAAANPVVATDNEEISNSGIPEDFRLKQNYPNPFNPTTTIEYALPQTTQVTLTVYDVLGREVATLVNRRQSAGTHSIQFDASRLASGMYLYRIEAGDFVQTRKLMLVK